MSNVENKLSCLLVGDTVIVNHSGYRGWQEICMIDRVTPTTIIVRDTKYNRTTGRECGSGVFRGSISFPEEKEVNRIRAEKRRSILIRGLSDYKWDSMNTETLEKITELLKP